MYFDICYTRYISRCDCTINLSSPVQAMTVPACRCWRCRSGTHSSTGSEGTLAAGSPSAVAVMATVTATATAACTPSSGTRTERSSTGEKADVDLPIISSRCRSHFTGGLVTLLTRKLPLEVSRDLACPDHFFHETFFSPERQFSF